VRSKLMSDSVDKLLAQYHQHATVHASIDYGDDSSVRAGNAAADAMVNVAKRLAAMSPPAVEPFSSLLDADDSTAQWAAHHLLEHFTPDDEISRSALAVIERAASGDGVNAMGNRMWLDDWRKRHSRPTI
jgi:hypothetical protein